MMNVFYCIKIINKLVYLCFFCIKSKIIVGDLASRSSI